MGSLLCILRDASPRRGICGIVFSENICYLHARGCEVHVAARNNLAAKKFPTRVERIHGIGANTAKYQKMSPQACAAAWEMVQPYTDTHVQKELEAIYFPEA